MIGTDEVEMEQEMIWDYIPGDQAAEQSAFASNSEDNLIHAAQQGDLSAFNRLVLAHQDSLYGWIASLADDDMLADDITQQTFVSAYEKLSTFRGGSLQAWLFKIARNRFFDELRFQRHHPSVRLDAGKYDEDVFGLFSVLPASAPTPEEVVIQEEQAGWILQLLDRLPGPFRQALELVDLYEMDYQEAAGLLGLPPGTVKSRVARARLKLRQMIAQHHDLL